MSALVSGILKDPAEQPIPNSTITFRPINNSFVVLAGSGVHAQTAADGSYSFILEPASYEVNVRMGGRSVFYGAITVTSTTPPSTLNELLLQAEMDMEVPSNLQEYFHQVQESVKADADRAERAENAEEAAVRAESARDQAEAALASTQVIADKFSDLDDAVAQTQQNKNDSAASANQALSYQNQSEQFASDASAAAQRAEQSASGVQDLTTRVVRTPSGESLSELPSSSVRENNILSFGSQGDIKLLPFAGFSMLDGNGKVPFSTLPAQSIRDDVFSSLGSQDGYRYIGEVLSFAALRSLTPSSAGLKVRLRQYSSSNPYAGGGEFISFIGTATDDGGIIASGNGFYWKRVGFNFVTPQMFNAIANNSIDDSPSFRACYAASVNYGVPMRIPSGNYYFGSGTVTISSQNSLIEGDGIGKTVINSAAALTVFTIRPSVNLTTIRNMSIYSRGTSRTTGSRAVYANGGSISSGSIGYVRCENLDVIGFDDAINLQYCQLGSVSGCMFTANNRGYYSYYGINMRIFSNKFILCYKESIYLNGNSAEVSFSCGTLMSNNEIVNGGASGSSSVFIINNEHFTLSNNMVDAPNSAAVNAVHVIGTSRGTISSNWIGAHPQVGVRLENCLSVMVVSNNILSHKSYGIAILGSSENCVISNNCLEDNVSTDILIGGGATLISVNGNICRSTTSAYSYQESANGKRCVVTGNMFNQAVAYDSGSTVFANNLNY